MYVTCLLFVFVVLGGIARATGFSLIRFLKYISEEILIVLGTSSSESALPKIMEKLERIGCPKPIVGLVVPTGYSFNLDGTSIYMTMAALFVAQASGVHLSFGQQLSLLGILLLTSKGAAAVTGAGFITLAATLSAFPNIPIAGLALLLGVDRFMSEARSITNLIGNAVATMVIARWEGALDMARVKRVLAHGVPELHDDGSTRWPARSSRCARSASDGSRHSARRDRETEVPGRSSLACVHPQRSDRRYATAAGRRPTFADGASARCTTADTKNPTNQA